MTNKPGPFRIAYGRIFHEANAFSPVATDRRAFERMHYVAGDKLARAASLRGSELAGYLLEDFGPPFASGPNPWSLSRQVVERCRLTSDLRRIAR